MPATYLLSAARLLRPGTPTLLAVTILSNNNTLLPVRVTAEVTNGNTSLVRAETTFRAGETGIMSLPSFPKSSVNQGYSFTLIVTGFQEGRLLFRNATALNYNPNTFTAFIQTDRHSYRPGDTVRLRVLCVQPDGRPRPGSLDLSVRDPRGDIVSQWVSLASYLGVVSRDFNLSVAPPNGTWAVSVTVDELTTESQFLVDYNELPQFKVHVKTPAEIGLWNDLLGNVTAQHTNGKPVVGSLHVTVTLISASSDKTISSIILDTTKRIHRSTQFLFPNDDLIRQHGSADPVGSEHNTDECLRFKTCKTVVVPLFENTHHLEFYSVPRVLKPSLHFSTDLKISRYNKEPLTPADLGNTVQVRICNRTSKSSERERENPPPLRDNTEEIETYMRLNFSVPADGLVHIEFQLQEHAEMLFIQATYMGSNRTLEVYSSNRSSPTGSYVQIQPISSSPQIGKPLRLYVESTFQLTRLHYLVTSMGQIVAAGTATSSSFELTPAVSWSPEVRIIVYCVRHDGEVVNDDVDVFVKPDDVLKNQVSLSWSNVKVKPGEEVSLTVNVLEPGSLVGITVVAAEDGGISDEEVSDNLPEYLKDTETHKNGMTGWKDSPLSTFRASSLVVLTDAGLRNTEDLEDTETADTMDGTALGIAELWADWVSTVEPGSETWLWLDTNVSESRSLRLSVPDSLTSWRAVAFVTSENMGLGLTLKPQKLTVSRDFSLLLDIPESITRGEQLVLEVNLFNHLEQDLQVIVWVAENHSFRFLTEDDDLVSTMKEHTVTLNSGGSFTCLIPIQPLVHGEITVTVKAQAGHVSEEITRRVLVKFEGKEQWFSKTLFLEVPPSMRNLSRQLHFSFPRDAVPLSQRAHIAVVGDVLGLSITGLDTLVEMPHGCGEQNMIHFAPGVFVLEHLAQLNQSNEKIRAHALSLITEGYQQQLQFQRDDGSFSAFGASDKSGSVWLTAFVLRCFLQAQTFMKIDRGVVARAMLWMVRQQRPRGEFVEVGAVINTELQGGLDGPIALTAYVLMTLLEDQSYMSTFQDNVSMAMGYLEDKVTSGVSSNYSLCLVAYALSLANSHVAGAVLTELMRKADFRDGVPAWRASFAEVSDSWQPRAAEIEMAAYVLLALNQLARMEDGFNLLKWLSEQRNHLGGYGSTQDTVAALKALSVYAVLSGAHAIELEIQVSTVAAPTPSHFNVNSSNYLVNQNKELDAENHLVIDVFMKGRGFALFQLNVFYNIEGSVPIETSSANREQEGFSLDVKVTDDENNLDHMLVSVCTRLLASQRIARTGMVLLDVGVLSGFTLAPDTVDIGDLVKKIETSSGKVILYLDSLTTKQVCINFPMIRAFKVSQVRDAFVQVYDYYEPRRRAVRSYNSRVMKDLNVCEFCGSDCDLCRHAALSSASSTGSRRNSALYCWGFVLIVPIALLLDRGICIPPTRARLTRRLGEISAPIVSRALLWPGWEGGKEEKTDRERRNSPEMDTCLACDVCHDDVHLGQDRLQSPGRETWKLL
ncbi:hypothetical protein DPEC_G00314120 [Dallia pectoralis]|uniref:Uncharacterized protein n=1 Tax=Dallia pectoralis TaxID=75939 RepID=A0ACC2FC14_DALPE|nr:hypothetical protein DPEC_G00314120 [Dallia pectoralis]